MCKIGKLANISQPPLNVLMIPVFSEKMRGNREDIGLQALEMLQGGCHSTFSDDNWKRFIPNSNLLLVDYFR